MRDDIAKLICERPRSGQDGGVHGRIHRRRLNRLDGETDVKYESMSRMSRRRGRGGIHTKEFTDFLTPIKGFLAKNVGRPWDKVYSEVRAVLPADNTTQQHVYAHLHQYVERNPVFDDGRVFRPQVWLRTRAELRNGEYYVSRHGLLLCYRRKKTNDKRAAVEACQLADGSSGYVKYGGVWYFVRFKLLSLLLASPEVVRAEDVFGIQSVDRAVEAYGVLRATGGSWYRIATKRFVMSKRDIKQYVQEP